ncbi:hypothetical protein QR680_008582 [Steinernema hermaphroditum]|uniref:Uncharacterized protein n=1 Tax=Steinernema hermaphroditum TaxID=289476 RepID=A0AA39IH45_9BILA|nr:hypothetical protein QR680_008582 [Steinernema hermaphroditum]
MSSAMMMPGGGRWAPMPPSGVDPTSSLGLKRSQEESPEREEERHCIEYSKHSPRRVIIARAAFLLGNVVVLASPCRPPLVCMGFAPSSPPVAPKCAAAARIATALPGALPVCVVPRSLLHQHH